MLQRTLRIAANALCMLYAAHVVNLYVLRNLRVHHFVLYSTSRNLSLLVAQGLDLLALESAGPRIGQVHAVTCRYMTSMPLHTVTPGRALDRCARFLMEVISCDALYPLHAVTP